MTADTSRTPLRNRGIDLGKPLAWAIYDRNQNLLLTRGQS